ncbi:hypothetical protein LCGC14_2304300 [marine sediment metagenome]|uniref:Uncharacterized protein n=1 Tax=marine sediment metagenome TaxID=412755 RepID=A0A0F9CN07_9ZZZZ
MMIEHPEFVGGPEDGKTIEERFAVGHPLHGTLPNGIRIPTNSPPAEPGPMHIYEFEGGRYVYRGTDGA